MLDRYLEDGGNFIDTANTYTDGRSEETIGAYLDKHPGLRDRLVIATKFAANMFPGDPNGGGAGRKAIMHQVEASPSFQQAGATINGVQTSEFRIRRRSNR